MNNSIILATRPLKHYPSTTCWRRLRQRSQVRLLHEQQRPTYTIPDLKSDASLFLLFLQRAVTAYGITHLIGEYVADIQLCEGPSMLPTLNFTGDVILVEKVSLRLWGIHDGESAFGRTQAARRRQDEFAISDVWHATIIAETAFTWSKALREQLWSPISLGDVVVADHPIKTGSICKRVAGLPGDQVIERRTGKIQRVPDGHVWLEGDNAERSRDSRFYGPVPVALLKGRVVSRLWPIRGNAWMQRRHASSSTTLPAGYRGEHIAKSETEAKSLTSK